MSSYDYREVRAAQYQADMARLEAKRLQAEHEQRAKAKKASDEAVNAVIGDLNITEVPEPVDPRTDYEMVRDVFRSEHPVGYAEMKEENYRKRLKERLAPATQSAARASDEAEGQRLREYFSQDRPELDIDSLEDDSLEYNEDGWAD